MVLVRLGRLEGVVWSSFEAWDVVVCVSHTEGEGGRGNKVCTPQAASLAHENVENLSKTRFC